MMMMMTIMVVVMMTSRKIRSYSLSVDSAR
jgi:hypothetical protein